MTKRHQSSNVAFIFVKMASVMGVTWIFGIAANLEALSFLWYPYVVLNSLQGKCNKADLGRRKNGTFSSLESPDTT